MIDFIYKPKESRIWRWKYRHEAEDGKIEDMSLGTSDKQVAERRRSDWLREKKHERGGLIPAKATREAAKRKLADHLEDFVGDLQRLGKAEKYLANIEFRGTRLIEECGWVLPKDATADSFQRWRREHPELAGKTVNDYLEAARCLFNWLAKQGRVGTNPLQAVEKIGMRGAETRAAPYTHFAATAPSPP